MMVTNQASTFLLALHTARFLRCQQIVGQLRQRVRRCLADSVHRPQRQIPPWPGWAWNPVNAFLPPCPRQRLESEVLNGRMEFLNSVRQVGWPPNWDQESAPKLWQYNLGYHDFLWDISFPQAKAAVLDWIEKCPYGSRSIGWEPYPVSLRLTNWCTYLFGQNRSEMETDVAFREAAWSSIHQQASFLERRLETHLLGNHLLENAVALSIAGSCFGGSAANRWLRRGIGILQRQLLEQMLEDGGHFERSPMYHSRVVWCLLTLLNTGERELAKLVRGPLERGLRALSAMCHPDGQIALLNDSAIGIYTQNDLLHLGAKALGVTVESTQGSFALSSTGYYGSRTSKGHYLICDFAPIGPDYLPGHSHGDIFSFELSYHGHRIVVDSGVFDYEVSDTRSYCRSTPAHNTVTIAGQDQCEFWGAFRVARRGRPYDVRWVPFDGGFRVQGWHDGYSRLRGKPKHARQLTWYDAGILLIRDEVGSKRNVEAISRIHLHPDCTVVRQNENSVEVNSPAGLVSVRFAGIGTLRVEDALYFPEFGLRLPNKALAWSARGSDLRLGCCIAPVQRVEAFDLEHGVTLNGQRYEF
jgi:uncharacterized heparinase superfamily protein